LSFSELSQRYVPAESLGMITPPVMNTPEDAMDLSLAFDEARNAYGWIVSTLEKRGITGKRAREAARAALPNCIETRIVVSGNVRAWRDFLKQRLSPHADAEIQLFAKEIYKNLVHIAPSSMIGIDDSQNS
jgi:thymidylate synthase (FAD)